MNIDSLKVHEPRKKRIIDLWPFDNGTLVLWENLQQDFEESDEDNEEHFERLMSKQRLIVNLFSSIYRT